MGETFTTRLGAVKPNRDTSTPLDVSQLNSNADLWDAAIGASHVGPGQTPATAELYDGKIVREKSTSKVWIAEKQTNGSYLKRWVNYAWSARVVRRNANFNIPINAYTEIPLTSYLTANSRNSTEADTLFAGRIRVPVQGLYSLKYGFIWRGAAANLQVNQRGIAIGLNNSISHSYFADAADLINLGSPGPALAADIYQRMSVDITLVAGTDVSVYAFQNSNTNPMVVDDAYLTVTLITPDPASS